MAGPLKELGAFALGMVVAFGALTGARASAQSVPGETRLEDVLQVHVFGREVLAVDARGGGETREALGVGEQVLRTEARGTIGIVLTDRRILAVGVRSAAWQEARYRLREKLVEPPLLGARVALLVTNERLLGFDGGSGNLVERDLGPRERVLGRAVSDHVAVLVTERRALGLSPFAGGFFEAPLGLAETYRSAEASGNLATVRTSRRLLTFRAPSGSWGERRLGLDP